MTYEETQANEILDTAPMTRIEAFGLSTTCPNNGIDNIHRLRNGPQEQGGNHEESDDDDYDFWEDPKSVYADMTNRSDEPLTQQDISNLLNGNQLQLGIDKLVLQTFPWALQPGTEWEWDQTSTQNNHRPGIRRTKTHIATTGHKVHMWLSEPADDGPLRLKLSFNPSEKRSLVSLNDTLAITLQILEETEDLVELTGTPGDIRILEIHITADCAPVDNLPATLAALESSEPKKGWISSVTTGRSKRSGKTIKHSTKTAGEIVAYDKSAEAGLNEPTLRIEAKVSNKARAKYGLTEIRDLTEASIQHAFNDLTSPFREALINQPDRTPLATLPPRAIAEAVGAMWCKENHIHLPFCRSANSRHRKLYKQFGITRTDDLLN